MISSPRSSLLHVPRRSSLLWAGTPLTIQWVLSNLQTSRPTRGISFYSIVSRHRPHLSGYNLTSHPDPVTEGNHTAIQSTFSSPCIPAHITNQTINGFDSGFRNTDNGTAITTLTFTVTDPNTTVWFYDANTCAQGGVGGININESSTETLDGFQARFHFISFRKLSADARRFFCLA